MNPRTHFLTVMAACLLAGSPANFLRGQPAELRTGVAGHAFDHLGTIPDQAEAAAAGGATIIYASGLGGSGYLGLPQPEIISQERQATQAYIQNAKHHGIKLVIGYVCATSIVKLDTFDKNWTPEFRARFHTPPALWRQQDRNGAPLPSWYGGDYQPACMNNPDWREYERFMVREQLEAGCDGIFFDNPTVHAEGCYCPCCMQQFARFLQHEDDLPPSQMPSLPLLDSTVALRNWAENHSAEFMKFRCTIARDFFAGMRACARSFKPGALITANNSLNSPDVFYAQCRSVAYNIYQMSRAEDFVVVEDMSTQPRVLANGQAIEYTPVYQLLHAIAHGKPLVAVNLADADYHTPPNLMRLASAEAAANDASYLAWPTWPAEQRQRMSALVRPEADLLRANAGLFQNTSARADVVLFLPFRRWLVTDQCRAYQLATELTRANVAYRVICEDDLRIETTTRAFPGKAQADARNALPERLHGVKRLLVESASVFTPRELKVLEDFKHQGGVLFTADKTDWFSSLQTAIGKPAILVRGPATVRALVRDQRGKTIVHLLSLNVQRLTSYEDKVFPATDVRVAIHVPFKKVHSVRALTADAAASSGALKFSAITKGAENNVDITIPRLDISTILVIE